MCYRSIHPTHLSIYLFTPRLIQLFIQTQYSGLGIMAHHTISQCSTDVLEYLSTKSHQTTLMSRLHPEKKKSIYNSLTVIWFTLVILFPRSREPGAYMSVFVYQPLGWVSFLGILFHNCPSPHYPQSLYIYTSHLGLLSKKVK